MPRSVRSAILAGSLICLLAGCLPGPRLEDKPPTIKTDEFSKSITIKGPARRVYLGLDFTLFTNLFTIIDKATHRYRHQIGVDVVYDTVNQIGYRYAADDTAQRLPLISVAHTRSRVCKDCSREEIFDIDVSDAALRAHAQTGYRVKIWSTLGDSIIFEITPPMIAAQYAALEQVIGPQAAGSKAARGTTSSPARAAGLSAGGPAGKPFLGILPVDWKFGSGVLVARVDPRTPAEAAGFQVGDLIRAYNGHKIKTAQEVRDLIAQTPLGTRVPIEIDRHGTHLTLMAQL
jgi:PDZ domain